MITSYNLFLRTSQTNKDGTHTVCLRIVNNRKQKLFSLRIYVLKKDWNLKKGIVNRSDLQHYIKNKLIEKYRAKAQQIIADYLLADKNLTFAEFEQHFFNNIYGTNSFYDFIESELNKSDNELAKATLKGYHSQFRKLKRYRAELSFNEIDFTFLRSYELFLAETNNQNTINKGLTFIKAFLNKAIAQNIYKGENPFINYPISRVQGKRDYLTTHEVEKLKTLLNSDKLKSNRKNVLRYFLFCCYTGLRYSDIKLLKFKNIHNVNHNDTEQKIISIDMHKTKKLVRIPIIQPAKNLIFYPDHMIQEMPVFKVMSSQPTNRYLKEIVKEVGITKNISFHVARHTFATNGLEFGIPIEVISQILGHSDLRTTQIYAKVSDKLKIEQMQKMEK